MAGGLGDRLKRQLLWGVVGLMAYIGGALFLLIAVMPMLSEGGFEMEGLGTAHAMLLLGSVLLFMLGGFAHRKMRGDMQPQQHSPSGLPDQYTQHLAPGDRTDEPPEDRPEPPKNRQDSGEKTCPECGASNDQFYSYCGECSAKL